MRILIRGTNWIGDAVMTVPAIRKLRRLFPEATLVLYTPEATAGIFKQSGLVDEIIPTSSFLDQVRSIRRAQFDLAVLFPNSFKTALVKWLAGVKRRFGYAAQNRSILLSDAIEVPDWKNDRHEVFYYLNIVDQIERAYGLHDSGAEPDTRIEQAEADRETARQLLESNGVDLSRRIVGLAPGSTNSRAKRWTPEGFAGLNDLVQTELGASVVLLGSPGDAEVSARVIELSKTKPIDLTGKTDIAMAAGVLSNLDLLVSNDMGLAHLAPAVGTRTIVIFGPTNPVTTRPFSALASIMSAGVECSPCMLRDCPIDHRCMIRITPEMVFERAKELLER